MSEPLKCSTPRTNYQSCTACSLVGYKLTPPETRVINTSQILHRLGWILLVPCTMCIYLTRDINVVFFVSILTLFIESGLLCYYLDQITLNRYSKKHPEILYSS